VFGGWDIFEEDCYSAAKTAGVIEQSLLDKVRPELEKIRPWPAVSDFMDGHHVLIGIASYVTVLVQVAFPFSLFSKLKYVLLVILMGMHLGIALLIGLPIFSAVMILGDAVFLPDRFFRFLARRWKARRWKARRARRGTPAVREINETRAVPVR